MIQEQTSRIANEKYADKKPRDRAIILSVLREHGPLTAYGIARKAYYQVEVNGQTRVMKIDYLAVSRRMKELRNNDLIEVDFSNGTGVKVDDDKATRTIYKLK